MKTQEILEKYLSFYQKREHKLIPNVSLVPQNDPTLLFVNSGMFPLVPYLSGEPHELGKRLVNIQRCVRFEDLENVGNTNRHTVAFHMIGNWGLGDYFKKEQLPWMYEFFIEVLGFDVNKIYGTVFPGNKNAPKDTESIELIKQIFKKYGIEAKEGVRIFESEKNNWWQRGEAIGELGGPSSEIFYYIGKDGTGEGKDLIENEDEFIEIGNSVFMQFKKTLQGWEPLSQKNIDYGGGLERVALISQKKDDIFETDNFWPIIETLQEISEKDYKQNPEITKSMRVIADHLRASTLIAMDGVVPSNKDQGYILRRLLRRMLRVARVLGIDPNISLAKELIPSVVKIFSWIYPELKNKQKNIINIVSEEEEKFNKILTKGRIKSQKILQENKFNREELVEEAFNLYQSVGYPIEIFIEDAKDQKIIIDEKEFAQKFKEIEKTHQEKSRKGAEHKFKGGLANHSEVNIKYHTATHLLHWALREVIGKHVSQKGSNITNERLRFDFSNKDKLTIDEISKIEKQINAQIDKALPVEFVIMPKKEAEKTQALHLFGEKYGEQVKIYYIGNSLDSAISKEFCGGPHVQNTSEIPHIQIYKQKKIGEDLIRIYAHFKS